MRTRRNALARTDERIPRTLEFSVSSLETMPESILHTNYISKLFPRLSIRDFHINEPLPKKHSCRIRPGTRSPDGRRALVTSTFMGSISPETVVFTLFIYINKGSLEDFQMLRPRKKIRIITQQRWNLFNVI